MLHIYTDAKYVPNDREIIWDADAFFGYFKLSDDEYTRHVIESVEGGRYAYDDRFYDRFDRPLYISCLSTGSKSLLAAYYACDMPYVINLGELGAHNCDELVYLKEGYVLWPHHTNICEENGVGAYVNGRRYDTMFDVNLVL